MNVNYAATPFNPYTEGVRRDPYPAYAWLRDNDPVHRGVDGIWFVSRFADVGLVLKDDRFGRAGFRDHVREAVGPGPLEEILRRSLFYLDPPDHHRIHKLLRRPFRRGEVEKLQPKVDEAVARLLRTRGTADRIDVVKDLAEPLSVATVCEFLGFPASDHQRVFQWSTALEETADPVISTEATRRAHEAAAAFSEYMDALLRRQAIKSGAVLEVLAGAVGHVIDKPEFVATAMVLLNAGHQTTTHLIGNGFRALVQFDDVLREVEDDPALVPLVVEEALRYDAPVQQNAREVQADDVVLHGLNVPRGEIIVALQGSANRDPRVVPDPDSFLIRHGVEHLSFGRGLRYCVGAPLGRLQAIAAFRGLLAVGRQFRLEIPESGLAFLRSSLFRGTTSLPIGFVPR